MVARVMPMSAVVAMQAALDAGARLVFRSPDGSFLWMSDVPAELEGAMVAGGWKTFLRRLGRQARWFYYASCA